MARLCTYVYVVCLGGLFDNISVCCIVLEQRAHTYRAHTEGFKADLACLCKFGGSRQNVFVSTLCGETSLSVNVQCIKRDWLSDEPTAALTHPFWIKRKAVCSISVSVTAMALSLIALVCP